MQNAADYYKANEQELYIETASGKKFFIDRPEFDMDDVAHALSLQCRFTGHVKKHYSVATHSLLVMYLMRELGTGNPLEGLLHDVSEAYLSDIAAPWKVLLPDYKKLEARIEAPLRAKFNLPPTISDECKRCDWIALFIEAHNLMPSKAADWIAPPGIKEQAAKLNEKYCVFDWNPAQSKDRFLHYFNRLTREEQK